MPASQPPPSPASSVFAAACSPIGALARFARRRGGFEPLRAKHRELEQQRRDDQQIDRAERHGERDRQRRARAARRPIRPRR